MARYTQHLPRQANDEHVAPYYVPTQKSGNLFQKIKGFFSQPNKVKNNEPIASGTHGQQRQTKKKHPFEKVNVSAIDLSLQSNLSYTSKNPNDTLSEFFNKKGDTPLNDIEIEGVLSLIKKSQTSRAPSRNNSTMFSVTNNNIHPQPQHHLLNHSMFLNSNTDSKLGGLSSFNDVNNTTILRPASGKMKAPVRINTPTYVPRKPSDSRHVTLDNPALHNTSNKSFNSSMGSRSFMNTGAIRKRRIVDYSTLQSPYKVKTSSSLSAFLEKKKLLEKQANEQKAQLLKTQAAATEDKTGINYNGGIIDLSNLDENDDEREVHKKKIKVDLVKPLESQNLSKTASKVLDILNFDSAKKTTSEDPKPASKPVSSESLIITIDDEDDDVAKTEPQQPKLNNFKSIPKEIPAVKPLPVFNFKAQKELGKDFTKQSAKEPVKESLMENKPSQFNFKGVEQQNKQSEPASIIPTFSFGSTKATSANSTENKSPVFHFGNPLKPQALEENVRKALDNTVAPRVQPPVNGIKEETPSELDDLEIIDSFEFPDVEIFHSDTASGSNNHASNGVYSKPIVDGSAEPRFEFPAIPNISPKTLELFEAEPADQYQDVFRF